LAITSLILLSRVERIERARFYRNNFHSARRKDQLITVDERYATIVKDMQQIARASLIFGLHVHAGIPDREEAIDIINQARYFLPHIECIIREGAGADRQLSVWERTHDMKAVVDQIIEETYEGLTLPPHSRQPDQSRSSACCEGR
jgi:gamma-glutamyl:cysteine ligase YbdK (ATP-grasp superfamily)